MIRVTEQTILLISDDAELWAAVRQEFEAREEAPRVTTVSTLEAARRILEDAAPTVILLEEGAVPVADPVTHRRLRSRLPGGGPRHRRGRGREPP